MVRCNSENVFPSAKIYQGKSTDTHFYVYKVNSKSMYIGTETYEEIMRRWESRIKGHTWKKLMDSVKAKMVKYDDFYITEDESERKKTFNKIKEVKEGQKRYLNRTGENLVSKIYENKFLKGKNYKFPIETNGHKVVMVVANNERNVLLNIDGELIFFDIDKGIYIPYVKSLHKNGKELIWPKSIVEEKKAS